MADEQKTDNVDNTPESTQNKMVELEQSKIDALISDGYKKGATKATEKVLEELGVESLDDVKALLNAKAEAEEAEKSELQKAQERLEAIEAEAEALRKANAQKESDLKVTQLAAQHGVTDTDYLKYQLTQAQKSEDFNESAFIENLKETKPFLFGQPSTVPKVDASRNKQEVDVSTKIRAARSMQDLYKVAGN